MSKYLVGIDLGTTNTVVYYVDKTIEDAAPQLFNILQVTENGEVEECDALPSFLYLPDEKDVPEGALDLPWQRNMTFSAGKLARKNASQLPGKVVASTKSWLCAENVDRLAPILPWNRNNPEKQLSPLAASKCLLDHIKNAWDHRFAEEDTEAMLENQEVILTVPASFDAVARELTVKAAEEADLNVILLEEPLAAFYSWLHDAGDTWRQQLQPDDVVLVCDIGGGTTDFTLIKAVANEGNLEFERIAVGNHILLGGDNMDLTTAYTVANKLKTEKNTTLDNYQIAGLTHACREAKEVLLESESAQPQKLTVLGRGSSLIGATITTEINHQELASVILDGFFPPCNFSDKPAEAPRAGLRSFGLSYEANPAITLHLANFLYQHTNGGAENMPNCILFNGGVTKSSAIRKRLTDAFQQWLPEDCELRIITGGDADKSVAQGGVCYGLARQGQGIRIKAGSSHSYYIGIESSMPAIPGFVPPVSALCVVPAGMEEGTGADIPYSGLGLLVGETSQFRFFSSTLRGDEEVGQIIDDVANTSELDELPVLTATLDVDSNETPAGSLLPITLRSELTETGTLQVWCLADNSDSKWKLEFELRRDDLLTGNSD